MIHINEPASKTYDKVKLCNLLYNLQDGCCHKCGKPMTPTFSSIHHGLIHDNKTNRRAFPELVHHFVNLFLVDNRCHTLYPSYMQIQNIDVIQRICREIVRPVNIAMSPQQLKEMILSVYKDYINWCE